MKKKKEKKLPVCLHYLHFTYVECRLIVNRTRDSRRTLCVILSKTNFASSSSSSPFLIRLCTFYTSIIRFYLIILYDVVVGTLLKTGFNPCWILDGERLTGSTVDCLEKLEVRRLMGVKYYTYYSII